MRREERRGRTVCPRRCARDGVREETEKTKDERAKRMRERNKKSFERAWNERQERKSRTAWGKVDGGWGGGRETSASKRMLRILGDARPPTSPSLPPPLFSLFPPSSAFLTSASFVKWCFLFESPAPKGFVLTMLSLSFFSMPSTVL